MLPYLFVAISVIFFAIGVFIDNFLSNKMFKDTKVLLFYSNITNLLFIPLVWIFGMPKALPTGFIIPILILSIAQIIYLYPYFLALKEQDTSIITALFNLGKIFVPVLAFIIVQERLGLSQYLGFVIIIVSSFLLSYQGGFRINKAFWYMMATSIILAIYSTVLKYSLGSVDWITVLTWSAVFSTIITLIVGLVLYRKKIWNARSAYKKSFGQFMANEFVTFIGMASLTYAAVELPVTIVQGLLAAQPVVMVIIASIASRFYPRYFKEDLTWKSILRKSLLFIVMAIGIVMAVG